MSMLGSLSQEQEVPSHAPSPPSTRAAWEGQWLQLLLGVSPAESLPPSPWQVGVVGHMAVSLQRLLGHSQGLSRAQAALCHHSTAVALRG